MCGWVRACICVCVRHLAVHHQVANAASEVFVLELRVNVGNVLIHATELQNLAHVQVSKTHTQRQKKQTYHKSNSQR